MRAGERLRRRDGSTLSAVARGVARLSHGRVPPRGVTVAAVLALAAVVVTAWWAMDRPGGGYGSGGDVVRVGVAEGESIPDYLRASRARLDALLAGSADQEQTEIYALVAFTAYLTPDRVARVLDGVAVSEVFSRVPLPETQTQIVRIPASRLPADLEAGMADVAARKEAEARDYQERRAALGDSDRDQDLRRVYDSGARVAAAEAAAYRSHCACVYAAVVRATPARLDALAERDGVRVVDPAPQLRQLARAVFLPPLPEQRDVVRPPTDADLSEVTTSRKADPRDRPSGAVGAEQVRSPSPSRSGGAGETR